MKYETEKFQEVCEGVQFAWVDDSPETETVLVRIQAGCHTPYQININKLDIFHTIQKGNGVVIIGYPNSFKIDRIEFDTDFDSEPVKYSVPHGGSVCIVAKQPTQLLEKVDYSEDKPKGIVIFRNKTLSEISQADTNNRFQYTEATMHEFIDLYLELYSESE